MRLITKREKLLKPLQQVIGVVERKQTLPILANVLIIAENESLRFTTTDLEVELIARIETDIETPGAITIPARKLLDILRALPEGCDVTLSVDNDKALIKSDKSRFSLATLPASDFQTLEDIPFDGQLKLTQGTLKTLIERTQFSMAQNDVRYYLNGLLFDINDSHLRVVATDGHRLAYCEGTATTEPDTLNQQIIVPRKGVQELLRLLVNAEADITLHIGASHLQVMLDDIRFTSRLIDGKFPEYQRVIPTHPERIVLVERTLLREALGRVAILSGDKYRGVRLILTDWLLRIKAQNPDQDEAEEEVEINYQGGEMEIGFNVNYLLNVLDVLPSELAKIMFTNSNSSCLIEEPESEVSKYVIMPMRL